MLWNFLGPWHSWNERGFRKYLRKSNLGLPGLGEHRGFFFEMTLKASDWWDQGAWQSKEPSYGRKRCGWRANPLGQMGTGKKAMFKVNEKNLVQEKPPGGESKCQQRGHQSRKLEGWIRMTESLEDTFISDGHENFFNRNPKLYMSKSSDLCNTGSKCYWFGFWYFLLVVICLKAEKK